MPVETTVFIILAVVVLVALLMLFSEPSKRGGNKIQLELDRSAACGTYVNLEPKCEAVSITGTTRDAVNRVVEVCEKLDQLEGGYPNCKKGTADYTNCVQTCCRNQCSGGARCSSKEQCAYSATCDGTRPSGPPPACPPECFPGCQGKASCTGEFYNSCDSGFCNKAGYDSVKKCPV